MKVLTVAAALAALALAASAQALAADTLINEFTTQNLTEILGEMGGSEVTAKPDEEGITTVTAKFAGEPTNFTMIGCKSGQTCRDLQIWILYDADGDRFNAAYANGFNGEWLDATAYAAKDGSLMLRSLLIANGGVTREHVKESVKLLLNAQNLLVDYNSKQGQIAARPDAMKVLSSPTARQREPYIPRGEIAKRRLPQ